MIGELTNQEFERMISSVADQMSAPDFFPATMPENDLHPDPARLAGELVLLRNRVADLSSTVAELSSAVAELERHVSELSQHVGMQSNVRNFPRR